MKCWLKKGLQVSAMHGFNPLALLTVRYLPRYLRAARQYRALPYPGDFKLHGNWLPVLIDYADQAGVTRSHYFIMDLWMARRVVATQPKRHVDIGSRLDGFVAHVLASGLPVEEVDIRPLQDVPDGLSFIQADATTLAGVEDGSITSLSCLHAIEHFGLGRYGDPIDPFAPYKLLASVGRVMAKGGVFYFATPIGRERLEFNAHRVFNPARLEAALGDVGLKVQERAVITTDGTLKDNIESWQPYEQEHYGCGLWVVVKK